MPLTAKQQRFVDEYLIDLNATQAAIRAGYSAANAEVIGHQQLKKTSVSAAVAAAQAKRAAKTDITAERVLLEIQRMAMWDPAELVEIMRPIEDDPERVSDQGAIVTIDGRKYLIDGILTPRDIKKLPEGIRRAIVGWGWDRNSNFTLKLADKSKALDQLARHLGLYNDKLEITGIDKLAERVARAKQRVAK